MERLTLESFINMIKGHAEAGKKFFRVHKENGYNIRTLGGEAVPYFTSYTPAGVKNKKVAWDEMFNHLDAQGDEPYQAVMNEWELPFTPKAKAKNVKPKAEKTDKKPVKKAKKKAAK